MTGAANIWRGLWRKVVGLTPEPLPFPPPYQGMVAISSDVECTSWQAQLDLLDIFAKRGLECGFSYWCFGDEQMTWRLFNEDVSLAPYADAAAILIKAGMLDTLHSFGGVTDGNGAKFDRSSMGRSLEGLQKLGAKTRVYSNHGTVLDTQNVGGDWASYQEGDLPGSSAYHLDLTTDFGCRFFWTDIDYDNQIPYFQLDGLPERSLLVPQTGRDGTPILRFRRFRGDFKKAPYAGNFSEQLNLVLDYEPNGYSIVYQHLGVHRLPDGKPVPASDPYFNDDGLEALDRLAELDAGGKVLVTSTERLLMHAVLMMARPWHITQRDNTFVVSFTKNFRYEDVPFELGLCDLNGWYIPISEGQRVIAKLGSVEWELSSIQVNEQLYAGVPWERKPLQNILGEAIAIVGA